MVRGNKLDGELHHISLLTPSNLQSSRQLSFWKT